MRGLVLSMVLRGVTFYWTRDDSSNQALGYLFHTPHAYLLLLCKTFLWTLAYDFNYYCLHRALHFNAYLFKQIHLKHHSLLSPTGKATLYHTIWEQLLEILLPTIATQIALTGTFCHLNFQELAFFDKVRARHTWLCGGACMHGCS